MSGEKVIGQDALLGEAARTIQEALAAQRALRLVWQGWSPEYREHLTQPDCKCGPSPSGWAYCAGARELGYPKPQTNATIGA